MSETSTQGQAKSLRERNIRLVTVRDGRLRTTISMDATLYRILLTIFNDDPTDLAIWVRDQAFSRQCLRASKSKTRSRSRHVQSAALDLVRQYIESAVEGEPMSLESLKALTNQSTGRATGR